MSGVEALARVLHDQGCEAGYSCDVLHRSERYALPETWGRMAERILADPGPLLAALSEAGVLERDEDALIHYRHGVNSGTLRARNTPESIAAAVRQYERATHGPAGVERVEVRTTFAHTTEWRADD